MENWRTLFGEVFQMTRSKYSSLLRMISYYKNLQINMMTLSIYLAIFEHISHLYKCVWNRESIYDVCPCIWKTRTTIVPKTVTIHLSTTCVWLNRRQQHKAQVHHRNMFNRRKNIFYLQLTDALLILKLRYKSKRISKWKQQIDILSRPRVIQIGRYKVTLLCPTHSLWHFMLVRSKSYLMVYEN